MSKFIEMVFLVSAVLVLSFHSMLNLLMNFLGHACFGYLEKKWKLFTRKLPKVIYYAKFYENTLRHVKTTTLYLYLGQELHNDEIFSKPCVPMGDIF